MSRPRLLFLAQTLPYPPDGGVKIRTYHVLRLLAREFAVDALCFYRGAVGTGVADVDDSVRALEEHAEHVEAFQIPQERSKIRLLWDHLRSVVFRRPYTVYSYDSKEYLRRLRERLRGSDYDLVHVDSLDLVRYLTELDGLPVVCAHHNVESELLLRRAETVDSPLVGAYLRLQAGLLEREEDRWCPHVALNVMVSDRDRRTMQARIPEAAFTVVSNGVDTDAFRPRVSEPDDTEAGIVFVGGCTWFPNRDALEYFASDILPSVRRLRPEVEVTWVGRAEEEVRRTYRVDHGIEMTGYVDDIRPYVRDAACYVVPIRVGGGTRLKILDAWALGKAVVSTSQGCEGLEAVDGRNILIRDSASGFTEAVNRVLEDADLRARLGAEGRRTAEEVYSWEVIGEGMNATYRELLASQVDDKSNRDVVVGG